MTIINPMLFRDDITLHQHINHKGQVVYEEAYIYLLTDPRTGIPRYVGKTTNLQKRLESHLRTIVTKTNYPKSWWLMELIRLGLQPDITILDIVPYTEWREKEQEWIAYFRDAGWPLLNRNHFLKGCNCKYGHPQDLSCDNFLADTTLRHQQNIVNFIIYCE